MRRAAALAGLFATALGVRLWYLSEWAGTPLSTVLLGDGRRYDEWARQIAAGEWFGGEVFYQAPLYPYFLAAVYAVFGHDLGAARLVQVALGSAACLAVALAGARFFSNRVGFVAGGLLSLYAPAIFFDGLLQKAALDGFFMACLLFTLARQREHPAGATCLAAGGVLGAFALTRENALILVPVVATWLVLENRSEPPTRRLRRLGLLFVGLAVFLAPVAARNAWLGGGFLPTTSQLGTNFFIGNHAGANGRYLPLRPGRGSPAYEREDATDLAQAALGRPLGPSEVSDYWLSRSLDYVREQPVEWLGLLAWKSGLVWHAAEILDTDSIEAYEEQSALLRTLGRFLHFGTLVPLAVLGAWVTRRDWRKLWILHALALSIAGSVALFYVMGRYRYPLVPVLALLAGAGIVELWRCLAARSATALGRAALLLALVAVPCNWPARGDVDPRMITWYSLGLELVESERHEEGERALARALAIDPEFADIHVALGTARLARGDAKGALERFDEAIRLDPRHAAARTGAAAALLRQGDALAAEARLREALRLDPDLAEAHNDLAVALVRQGREDEALEALRTAVSLRPRDSVPRLNLARLLLALGRLSEARDPIEQVLAIEPENRDARSLLGRLTPP